MFYIPIFLLNSKQYIKKIKFFYKQKNIHFLINFLKQIFNFLLLSNLYINTFLPNILKKNNRKIPGKKNLKK